ncbi:acetyl esterase/lipase [Leifsonia sp. EB41]|uniref:alpha/beta hydrolase fold domain-containing protein n=1 Tax=Leifsonia sp. EB41 TaxID=3156260 RepID=UPI0035159656
MPTEHDFSEHGLRLDLHLPEGAAPLGTPPPVVVFVHGGGWRAGSRDVFVPTMRDEPSPFARIAAAGVAVASVDYRLSGDAVFPAQEDDVHAALDWLRAHADRLGVDTSRVVLWGESAGATLAALVALAPDSGVRGLIDWYGPSDLEALAAALGQSDDPTTREAGWLGHAVSADAERARAASPRHRVRPGAPPALIAHGLADAAVPPSQGELFAASLAGVGAEVELTLVPGAGHLWQGDVDREALLDAAIAFCVRVLG